MQSPEEVYVSLHTVRPVNATIPSSCQTTVKSQICHLKSFVSNLVGKICLLPQTSLSINSELRILTQFHSEHNICNGNNIIFVIMLMYTFTVVLKRHNEDVSADFHQLQPFFTQSTIFKGSKVTTQTNNFRLKLSF